MRARRKVHEKQNDLKRHMFWSYYLSYSLFMTLSYFSVPLLLRGLLLLISLNVNGLSSFAAKFYIAPITIIVGIFAGYYWLAEIISKITPIAWKWFLTVKKQREYERETDHYLKHHATQMQKRILETLMESEDNTYYFMPFEEVEDLERKSIIKRTALVSGDRKTYRYILEAKYLKRFKEHPKEYENNLKNTRFPKY